MKNEEVRICPRCAEREMPEPLRVEMRLEKAENLPDRFVCPECGYEEWAHLQSEHS